MFAPHSSTNTRRLASRPASPATIALQAALKNSSRSAAPSDLFSAEAHAPQRSRDSGVAHLDPSHTRQQLTSLRQRSRRAFVQVALEEPLHYPIHLAPLAG